MRVEKGVLILDSGYDIDHAIRAAREAKPEDRLVVSALKRVRERQPEAELESPISLGPDATVAVMNGLSYDQENKLGLFL